MTSALLSLNKLIEQAHLNGKKNQSIQIGYKLYNKLMNDRDFADEVLNSALNAQNHRYKDFKIQITTDAYALKLC